jgi:CheY-like chemotaxis protein
MTTTLTPARILTVDDDPIVRADLRVILEDAGFSVVPDARDGVEAVEHAREHAPDLIVLDLGLPGLDGFDAAASIRRERDVPIVALTGYSAPDVLERAAAAGADSYVLKPFSEDGLLSTIREALAARARRIEQDSRSYHLLAMIEGMVRDNMSEREITRALRHTETGSTPASPLRDSARALARRMGGIVGR